MKEANHLILTNFVSARFDRRVESYFGQFTNTLKFAERAYAAGVRVTRSVEFRLQGVEFKLLNLGLASRACELLIAPSKFVKILILKRELL